MSEVTWRTLGSIPDTQSTVESSTETVADSASEGAI